MAQFTSTWLDNSSGTPSYQGRKSLKSPGGTSVDQPRTPDIQRLRNGSRWLTEQHGLWMDANPAAVDDERFYQMMAVWEEVENQLRDGQGFTGCIFGPGERCPGEAIINCTACVSDQTASESEEVQLGFRPA